MEQCAHLLGSAKVASATELFEICYGARAASGAGHPEGAAEHRGGATEQRESAAKQRRAAA